MSGIGEAKSSMNPSAVVAAESNKATPVVDIEATIDLEVWLENAPEMQTEDEVWVATETRAAGCVFHPEGATPPTGAEHFEVDGTSVHFTVK